MPMKELVVISGKGGTGKTSVLASFAILADSRVVADCDVDASNLHLVLSPATISSETYCGGKIAVIDRDLCTSCGRCSAVCWFGGISRPDENDERIYQVEPLHCEGCGACTITCPAQAMSLGDVATGEWFISDSRAGPLVHAELGAGRENSGRLVTVVRSRAAALGKERGFALSLIDGPPGIGCPVIASLTGADLALCVTEPTVAGLHDLERAVGLARKLRVPVVVAVNKWDLNDGKAGEIERWCLKEGITVVGRIPYDDAVTRAQVAGTAVVEGEPGPAALSIRELWNETSRILGV